MKIQTKNNKLLIHFEGFEKLWAFRTSLMVPIDKITKVYKGFPPTTWKRIRLFGTHLPGVIVAGNFYVKYKKWEKEFWYWTNGSKVITIELRGEKFTRIVIGCKKIPSALTSLVIHTA